SLAALKAGASPEDAARQPEEPQQPARKPTLRRDGEPAEPTLQLPANGQTQPSHPAEPDWGTGGKPPDPPKPPPEIARIAVIGFRVLELRRSVAVGRLWWQIALAGCPSDRGDDAR